MLHRQILWDHVIFLCSLFSFLPECEFRCGSGQCVSRSRVCDGNGDCPDNSDEVNCSQPFMNVQTLTPDINTRCPALQDGFCHATNSCSTHRDCRAAGQICCNGLCGGQRCVEGEALTCREVRARQLSLGLLGAFIPTCRSDDGTFNQTQCHELYCWCVDTVSGQPTSDGRRIIASAGGIPDYPQCEEQRCTGRNSAVR